MLGCLIALTLLFIWGNSMRNASASGAMSGSVRVWLESLLHIPIDEFLLRKAAHFSEYALLGAELSLLLSLLSDRRGAPLAHGRNLIDFPALGFLAAAIDDDPDLHWARFLPCSTSGSTRRATSPAFSSSF